ncbi:MAG TPA: pilus assembly protein N-terminal domain-containing protein [Anaeromyxobacteraceae bacterium]|nr:pilus assembly protein N-terminal domain-containing protein [Anaeromyxobacteraceae bacterium]
MRAPLIRGAAAAALLLAAAAARAGAPLSLAERQVVTLEFSQPIAGVAVTDLEILSLRPQGTRLQITAQRVGRASIEVSFGDGAAVALDVTVDGARRSGRAVTPPASDEVQIALGEERRIPAPDVARVLVEENGVARARADGQAIFVTGLSPGSAAVVVMDGSGRRTSWTVRVR